MSINTKPLKAIVPAETFVKAEKLLDSIISGRSNLGCHAKLALGEADIKCFEPIDLVRVLFDTRQPTIFAEKSVAGDGSDWTLDELSILGDISIAAKVKIFDNGAHCDPLVHSQPFHGTLIFTAGALLDNGFGLMPADWQEVVRDGSSISQAGLLQLYRRRLVPVFTYINACSKEQQALVTMPGIGCGMFSGRFHGSVGRHLEEILLQLLRDHGKSWPNIDTVYFDPYKEWSNRLEVVNNILFNVKPSGILGNEPLPQLCRPVSYLLDEACLHRRQLFSIVAWDHVSWPGNDFYSGWRGTDDGVKAAATDVMLSTTGVKGFYCTGSNCYLPPVPFATWGELIESSFGRIRLLDRISF